MNLILKGFTPGLFLILILSCQQKAAGFDFNYEIKIDSSVVLKNEAVIFRYNKKGRAFDLYLSYPVFYIFKKRIDPCTKLSYSPLQAGGNLQYAVNLGSSYLFTYVNNTMGVADLDDDGDEEFFYLYDQKDRHGLAILDSFDLGWHIVEYVDNFHGFYYTGDRLYLVCLNDETDQFSMANYIARELQALKIMDDKAVESYFEFCSQNESSVR